ncbi:Response regulator receiver domain protein (CheY) [Pararhodospirillum photometricum DSM 122]|uniref:Response regulator receiver domain protein (CheY) n=2 Tax=Pararhodospirillum photometricum TaxID=1084 RepID=H6SPR2_PARPM|nr:Response regulator receiver domain protein (CheY) [Pararhodospirillum photometricum DSM 122]
MAAGVGSFTTGTSCMTSTILLIDDSATVLMSMETILHRAGFVIAKASSGEDALAQLQKGLKPGLVITDVHMPGMNGIDVIRKVRALPGYQFVPILVVTTESQQVKREEARAAKATGWLVKPVQPDDLLKVVRQILPNG